MSLDLMNGPIPGESLTAPMGGQPWKNPPQHPELDTALQHVFEKLTEPRQVTRLMLLLKKDTPVEYIARSIIFMGFGKGMWTPDVGLMMLKSVMAMIISIAHLKKVKHIIMNPDKDQNDFLDQFLDMSPESDPNALTESPQPAPAPSFSGVLGGNL